MGELEKLILEGPDDVELVLDPSEIIPDDPGMGTPAMVYWHGGSATWWFAVDRWVVCDGRWQGESYNELDLPREIVNWLDAQEGAIDEMYDAFEEQFERREGRKPW